jgi:hypothetical protein
LCNQDAKTRFASFVSGLRCKLRDTHGLHENTERLSHLPVVRKDYRLFVGFRGVVYCMSRLPYNFRSRKLARYTMPWCHHANPEVRWLQLVQTSKSKKLNPSQRIKTLHVKLNELQSQTLSGDACQPTEAACNTANEGIRSFVHSTQSIALPPAIHGCLTDWMTISHFDQCGVVWCSGLKAIVHLLWPSPRTISFISATIFAC